MPAQHLLLDSGFAPSARPAMTSKAGLSRQWNSAPSSLFCLGNSPAFPEAPMHFGYAHLQPIVSLIAGVLILLIPRLLNYIVAIYLIIVGLIGLGVVR
jgi:hypothetical protein